MSKDAYRHIFFLTANMSHSAFAESKTMETFHPEMSTYVKSCTWTRLRKSKWCRVISCSVVVVSRFLRGQLFFLGVVVSLLRDQSFFLLSRVDRRGQSSWAVIFSRSVNVLLGRRDQSTWSSWSIVVVSCSLWSVF